MPDHQLPPSNLPPGSIVDAYLRDSGGEGQDRSIQRQREAIQAYCQQHGLVLRHVYADAAKSGGSTAGRDQFDRMIASTRDPEARPVAILLWNYARFARDLDDSTYYKALLRSKRGILIHSLTDPIPEGPYGRFIEILIDISNEEKRRQTAIDTADGLRSIVSQGAVPGTPPRGFKREPIRTINPRTGQERTNHRWVPDPEYKDRILRAFQMRASGSSLDQVEKACHLFTSISSYASFWRNRLYYGTLEFGDMTIEHYCEPMVPRALWEKVQLVQNRYSQRRHVQADTLDHPRRANSDFILSGLARCGHCGSPLYGRTTITHAKYKYQSYLCTLAYRKRGACTKGRIPKHAFEYAIIHALTDVILIPQNLTDLIATIEEYQAAQGQAIQEQLSGLRSQLAEVKRQLTNVVNALAESGTSPALMTRLAALEGQQAELQNAIASAEAQAPEPPEPIDREVFAENLKGISNILLAKSNDEKRILLRGLISYIDVIREKDNLRITVYYSPPNADDASPPSPSPTNSPPPSNSDDDDLPALYVPSLRAPSGPPVYRPIMVYKFVAPAKRPR